MKLVIPIMILVALCITWGVGGWIVEQRNEAEEAKARIEQFKRESFAVIDRFEKEMAACKFDVRTLEERFSSIEQLKKANRAAGTQATPGTAAGDTELLKLAGELAELKREYEALRDALPENPRAEVTGQLPLLLEDMSPDTSAVFRDAIAQAQLLNDEGAGVPAAPPRPGRGSNAEAINWSADQASGAPDTPIAGDRPTAWASRDQDAGEEWLEVQFANWLTPDEIVVVESYNPGAVVRIDVLAADNQYYQVWAGEDPTSATPGELRVPFTQDMEIGAVRVTLDTSKVTGWNEIDAIGAVIGGETHWGSTSEASSSYSEVYPAQDSGENR